MPNSFEHWNDLPAEIRLRVGQLADPQTLSRLNRASRQDHEETRTELNRRRKDRLRGRQIVVWADVHNGANPLNLLDQLHEAAAAIHDETYRTRTIAALHHRVPEQLHLAFNQFQGALTAAEAVNQNPPPLHERLRSLVILTREFYDAANRRPSVLVTRIQSYLSSRAHAYHSTRNIQDPAPPIQSLALPGLEQSWIAAGGQAMDGEEA